MRILTFLLISITQIVAQQNINPLSNCLGNCAVCAID